METEQALACLGEKTKDDFELTPLCAITGKAPLEVIRYLLEENPNALRQKDRLIQDSLTNFLMAQFSTKLSVYAY